MVIQIENLSRLLAALFVTTLAFLAAGSTGAQWNQTSVPGPGGSLAFGSQTVVLSNGNYFVSDPGFDPGGAPGTGAVYLFDGASNQIISMATGGQAGDQIGSGGLWEIGFDRIVISSPEWNGTAGAATWMDNVGGVRIKVDHKNSIVGRVPGCRVSELGILTLFNRNYIVLSPSWTDGTRTHLGAVTWGANSHATFGEVSNQNSYVGRTQGDRVGSNAAAVLRNGNYVVRTPTWQDNGLLDVGAATWGDGTRGSSGDISPANSIVGSTAGDRVGQSVVGLTNSNYVVASSQWANGSAARAGAVTVGDGNVGTALVVSSSNSLVGTSTGDQVGSRVITLSGGNFLVMSPTWDDTNAGYSNVGAVTWGKYNGSIIGPVGDHNSKIGSNSGDNVGSGVAVSLPNGNYAFASPLWYKRRGAVTWGDAGGGSSYGYVSSKNSMVGANSNDQVGSGGVSPIVGGYVISSPNWDSYPWAVDAGAVTWGDAVNGSSGIVDASNSLVGTTTNDRVGSRGILPLNSGNYVALSPNWSWNGQSQVGAATFVQGGGPFSGVVSTSNSIHGDKTGDRVSHGGVVRIDRNYAVVSQFWASGGVDSMGIGAVTWGDGINGTTGPVSPANSLVGQAPGDRIGMGEINTSPAATGNGGIPALLFDRSIVIASPFWGSAGVNSDGVGAVTWFDHNGPTVGYVDASNSLVGNRNGDRVGSCGPGCWGVNALQNGQYYVYSSFWDDGGVVDAGAVTLAVAQGGTIGPVDKVNSVIGQIQGIAQAGGVLIAYPWLTPTGHLLVGLPFENRVVSIGP